MIIAVIILCITLIIKVLHRWHKHTKKILEEAERWVESEEDLNG